MLELGVNCVHLLMVFITIFLIPDLRVLLKLKMKKIIDPAHNLSYTL